LAVAAVVLGVAFLTPVGYFGLFLLPVWMLSTSIVLYRRQRPSVGRVVAAPAHASSGASLLHVTAGGDELAPGCVLVASSCASHGWARTCWNGYVHARTEEPVPDLRLYDYAASANCLKARLLLAQLERPYERISVDIFAGDTLTDEYAAI